ncbi:MAG: dockerin type I domain-containing protein, partial [Pirellulales bacterium]
GKFKTTSLRNVAVRGRFMHDGRFATLEEVIQFYNSGVQANPSLDPILKDQNGSPLRLNFGPTEIAAMVAFLNTLTDTEFLNDAKFSDPFVVLSGDYNGDGTVDADDYSTWKSSFGDTTSLVADGNGDGRVDAADYTVWRNNVGANWQDLAFGAGSGSPALGVPEPAGGTALLVALLTGWGAHRRRSRCHPLA